MTLSGCSDSKRLHTPNVQPSSSQPADADRAHITLIDATAPDSTQWAVSATVLYAPIDWDQEGATSQTRSFSNCRKPATTVFVSVPSLTPCDSTVVNSHSVELQANKIRQAGTRGITVDFERRMQVDKVNYFVRSVWIGITPCSAGCAEIREELKVNCWADERATEIFTGVFAMQFHERASKAPDDQTCAFQKGDYPGWHERETVMHRIRGRFGEADAALSFHLLDDFAVIPSRDGGWRPNKTFGWRDGTDLCKPEANGYDIVVANRKLDARFGWPYETDVEVRVYRRDDGKVCKIWLDSEVPHGEYVARVRYFYDFDMKGFVQLRTEEPNQTERRFAYVDGTAYEYVREQDKDSVAGGETILYWHRDAAVEWPQRMTYTPDLNEFETYSRAAAALLEEFGKLPATL